MILTSSAEERLFETRSFGGISSVFQRGYHPKIWDAYWATWRQVYSVATGLDFSYPFPKQIPFLKKCLSNTWWFPINCRLVYCVIFVMHIWHQRNANGILESFIKWMQERKIINYKTANCVLCSFSGVFFTEREFRGQAIQHPRHWHRFWAMSLTVLNQRQPSSLGPQPGKLEAPIAVKTDANFFIPLRQVTALPSRHIWLCPKHTKK